ncbi:MAG: DUF4329 domain-containing protein [Arenicellales bacterium]|nr:DUF4329 domain-containing protein [Arenicellales bacterium]
MSFHRSFGSNVLHYGTTYALNERHHYAGFSVGGATIAYFEGSGRAFSKTGSTLYQDLNHYFFHGGSGSAFSFQGAGLDFNLSKGTSAQFARTRIKAPNVDDRYGYYAGVSTPFFRGGLFGLERGNDWVGHGFNFATGGPRLNFEYQQINSETGAYVRRVGFSWKKNSTSSWSVNIEDVHNPLYESADEQRILFRYQRTLSRPRSFAASEDEEAEAKKKSQTKWATIVGVGVGVGVAAAAVSSGDDNNDNSERFATQHQAAFDVLNEINPVSVRENREHGGWVYRNADGSFGNTNPVGGGVASVNIGNPQTTVPGGTRATATYHTHGGPDPRYDNENFSPQDILSDRLAGVDGYLGTPAGFMKYHQLETGRISTIGRIAN